MPLGFKELIYFGKTKKNMEKKMFEHFERINFDKKVLDKMTIFEKFQEKLTDVIQTYNHSNKEIDKRELSRLIKNYIGESEYKIEEEKNFYQFRHEIKDVSTLSKQNQYVELVNKLLFMNIVNDSKNQLIIEINSIKTQENISKNRSLIALLELEKKDCEEKLKLVDKIDELSSIVHDMELKEFFEKFSGYNLPREFNEKLQEIKKDNDGNDLRDEISNFLESKKEEYRQKEVVKNFIKGLIKTIVNKEYFESKLFIKQTFTELKNVFSSELMYTIKELKKKSLQGPDENSVLNFSGQHIQSNNAEEINMENNESIERIQHIQEKVEESLALHNEEDQYEEKKIEEVSNIQFNENDLENLSFHNEAQKIVERRLILENQYLGIVQKLRDLIYENEKNEYFSSIKIIDSIKTIPLCFPKNTSFNQITNLQNFPIYFENNEIAPIQRIYYFIELVMAIERMFYINKRFFQVKKENLFIDRKTNRLKLISFYTPYEKSYHWTIYFKGLSDIKEKETYLKTFFNFLKRYCLENEMLKIKLNEKDFNIDSLLEDSKMLWKNKHIFIFEMIKNSVKQFLQVHNLKVFRNYRQNHRVDPKLLQEVQRITNMLIYFFCKSFKYG